MAIVPLSAAGEAPPEAAEPDHGLVGLGGDFGADAAVAFEGADGAPGFASAGAGEDGSGVCVVAEEPEVPPRLLT